MTRPRLLNSIMRKWAIMRADNRLTVIVMAAVVGLCSGLAAVALGRALHFAAATLADVHHYWWGVALPAVGASLSAIFLNFLLREQAGHGVPEVVYAVSKQGGRLRFRTSFSRLISSFLTIGSGGSAGPEAPVVISGAALGSNIARWLRLKERQRVILVGCGAAGAIAAIFNAPLTGLVFTVEVILGEWRAFNIIPIAISAVAGTELSRLLRGDELVFQHQQFRLHPVDIAASFGVVVLATIVSVLLGRLLNGMARFAHGTPLPRWLRPAVGGGAVGLIGIYWPVVLGEGYGYIQQMIQGAFDQGLGLAALLMVGKVLATSLTIGWGGSGGIFAPCLMIGSLLGVFYFRLLTWVVPAAALAGEGCFALLGIAGLISGLLQAPLTAIFLVVEITGGHDVILPLIVVSTLTSTFCFYIEPGSYYLRELIEKGQYLRPGTDARVLSDLTVAELVESGYRCVPADMLLRDFVSILEHSRSYLFPVHEPGTSRYKGMIFVDRIRPYLFDRQMHSVLFVDQLMETEVPTVTAGDELADVLNLMERENLSALPVVENERFVGMLSKAVLLDHYRKELIVQTSA
ncbi:MAG: chloride channel protein [Desulfobacteraceae bacterium]|nr:chloride channel protein [Desulfobacteraceae bacterium]